jgi:DNA-directed RNA polymerase subunit RPC12/RpoP
VLAPRCDHCGGKILGHGVESDGTIYCCAHCAHRAGVKELKDRA